MTKWTLGPSVRCLFTRTLQTRTHTRFGLIQMGNTRERAWSPCLKTDLFVCLYPLFQSSRTESPVKCSKSKPRECSLWKLGQTWASLLIAPTIIMVLAQSVRNLVVVTWTRTSTLTPPANRPIIQVVAITRRCPVQFLAFMFFFSSTSCLSTILLVSLVPASPRKTRPTHALTHLSRIPQVFSSKTKSPQFDHCSHSSQLDN